MPRIFFYLVSHAAGYNGHPLMVKIDGKDQIAEFSTREDAEMAKAIVLKLSIGKPMIHVEQGGGW